jgi:hypothetical protein
MSKSKTGDLQGKRLKPSSNLSEHYREIGIKAVTAATRKESIVPHRSRVSGNRKSKRGTARRGIPEQ